MLDMSTLTVAAATTPTVISVGLSHHLTKKKHRGKPTYHLKYHQGLELVRRFLIYASHRTVEELQGFTAQYVPVPTWVHVEEVTIEGKWLDESAEHLVAQLGPDGVERVGGKRWWKWRVKDVKAEWIEMRRHYHERLKHSEWAPRTMLYVHGGGYFFGSVDEHRYQMQRHARKMKARVFAPRYRLAPQFPFPCGLQDILASYLYLLSKQPASTIILCGDSAGGGMIAALLCILRDQNIPLPAGSIFISPWVDLTHSFPSVISDNSGDYIPAHGFLHKSSPAWPPPTDEDIEKALNEAKGAEKNPLPSPSLGTNLKDQMKSSKELKEDVQGFDIVSPASTSNRRVSTAAVPSKGVISVMIEGHEVRIKDQIQLYTTNELLSHPLVSPVLQGSLGGLPPMMVLVGGAEVLRDEQIYFAHKAANPRKYPPPEHAATAQQLAALNKYKNGTEVVLQVFDDCCHVTPTLSFTRPAKYMYRSIAKFGDWLFAREALANIDANAGAANTIPDTAPLSGIDTVGLGGSIDGASQLFSEEGAQIIKSDTMSVISSSSSSSSSEEEEEVSSSSSAGKHIARKLSTVTPAYDIPKFSNRMVRQRVDRKGNVYPLPPAAEMLAMQVPMEDIGCIKPEPVRRWMEGKQQWDSKYAKAKKRVQMQRAKEIAEGGYLRFDDDGSGVVEKPPPSALAGRRKSEAVAVPGRSFKPSYGLKLWSMIGSKQDTKTIKAVDKTEGKTETPPNEQLAPIPEDALSTSSSDETPLPTPELEKTQSQIDRGEGIATVPNAILIDSPPPIVDVTEPFEKLGMQDTDEPAKGKSLETPS